MLSAQRRSKRFVGVLVLVIALLVCGCASGVIPSDLGENRDQQDVAYGITASDSTFCDSNFSIFTTEFIPSEEGTYTETQSKPMEKLIG